MRPQEAEDGSGLHVEVDASQGVDVSMALTQSLGLGAAGTDTPAT